MSKFEELLNLNVNSKVEKRKDASNKIELSYLSWVYAWAEFKKVYPDATYTVKKFKNPITGIEVPYQYDSTTGYMVFTEVTAENLTYEMWLPVMNGANKAMKSEPYTYQTKYHGQKTVEAATMFDVNKAVMRCLVKNLAMFGLGLYIYAGEDLPENMNNDPDEIPDNPETKSIHNGFIGLEEKEILKKNIGMAEFAKEMNACGGKMSFAHYYELLEKAA